MSPLSQSRKALEEVLASASLKIPQMARVVGSAREMLRDSRIESQRLADEVESSATIANTYDLRKRIGYYNSKKVFGVEESIEALRTMSEDVQLFLTEADRGIVAVWLSARDQSPAAIVVIVF